MLGWTVVAYAHHPPSHLVFFDNCPMIYVAPMWTRPLVFDERLVWTHAFAMTLAFRCNCDPLNAIFVAVPLPMVFESEN